MILLPENVSRTLIPLFPGIQDTALYSALQGYMGKVLASSEPPLDFVYAICGEYHYFGGNPDNEEAASLVRSLPKGAYLVSFEDKWKKLFSRVLEGRYEIQQRYMLKKDMDALDEQHLLSLFSHIPEGFLLREMDKDIYSRARSCDWSMEYVEQYADADDFVRQGFGYCLMKGEQIACIAPAFSVFDEGIEVGIATNPSFRKLGLASICAARLVFEAKKRGLIANWDAANTISLHLSQKIGYRFDGTYTVHRILR